MTAKWAIHTPITEKIEGTSLLAVLSYHLDSVFRIYQSLLRSQEYRQRSFGHAGYDRRPLSDAQLLPSEYLCCCLTFYFLVHLKPFF